MHPSQIHLLANGLMLLGALVGLVCAGLAYGLELPLGALIAAHAGTIMGPTLIKFGYVGRLAACRAMGKPIDC